jgi:hypothetical protein
MIIPGCLLQQKVRLITAPTTKDVVRRIKYINVLACSSLSGKKFAINILSY